MTPSREEAAARLARKTYPSFTKTVIENFSDDSTKALASMVKEEIKVICRDDTESILKSDDVLGFSWKNTWKVFQTYLPQLSLFLKEIISVDNVNVICMIISIILKCRNAKMCLVQKVISLYLYGNAVHKKVVIYKVSSLFNLLFRSITVYSL